MEIHCPSPFPRKLKTVDGPARLMSFLCNEFVPRRQLTRNYSEIIYTIGNCVADYCVNNIKFRSYILRLELFHSTAFCLPACPACRLAKYGVVHRSSNSFHCSI